MFMVGSISESTYVTFVDAGSWKWNWKLKGKIPHTRFNIHLVKGLIDAQVSFVQVLLSCEGKFNWLYTWTRFVKCDFFVDYFVVTNQASYTIKTTRQLITNVGIVLAQVTLEFTWEMHLVLNLRLLFPHRPFLRHESRTVCCTLLWTIKITRGFRTEVCI